MLSFGINLMGVVILGKRSNYYLLIGAYPVTMGRERLFKKL